MNSTPKTFCFALMLTLVGVPVSQAFAEKVHLKSIQKRRPRRDNALEVVLDRHRRELKKVESIQSRRARSLATKTSALMTASDLLMVHEQMHNSPMDRFKNRKTRKQHERSKEDAWRDIDHAERLLETANDSLDQINRMSSQEEIKRELITQYIEWKNKSLVELTAEATSRHHEGAMKSIEAIRHLHGSRDNLKSISTERLMGRYYLSISKIEQSKTKELIELKTTLLAAASEIRNTKRHLPQSSASQAQASRLANKIETKANDAILVKSNEKALVKDSYTLKALLSDLEKITREIDEIALAEFESAVSQLES